MNEQVFVYVVCVSGINMDHVPVRVFVTEQAAVAFAATRREAKVVKVYMEVI